MQRLTIWVVAAGILAPLNGTQESPSLPDSRVLRVDAFFDSYGCSSPNYAGEYVKAADLYDLDFRILPAISLLESTCGAYQRYNNHWGWNSARTGFPSVPEGIHHIARELALGESYRERDLDRKLFTYNPRLAYVKAAKKLMREIYPSGGITHEAFVRRSARSAAVSQERYEGLPADHRSAIGHRRRSGKSGLRDRHPGG